MIQKDSSQRPAMKVVVVNIKSTQGNQNEPRRYNSGTSSDDTFRGTSYDQRNQSIGITDRQVLRERERRDRERRERGFLGRLLFMIRTLLRSFF